MSEDTATAIRLVLCGLLLIMGAIAFVLRILEIRQERREKREKNSDH